jgi:UDP-3-O-[3-hydroxymyristoyl] glucosamine N-acyltransferase
VRVNDGPTPLTNHPVAALISDDPYAIYALIAGVLHPPVGHAAGIHSSAVIADSAIISNSARVSANVVIGEDCSIAEGVHIAADCVLGKHGSIDDTIIGDGVRLDILIQVGHNARRGEALEKRVAELEGKVNKNDG